MRQDAAQCVLQRQFGKFHVNCPGARTAGHFSHDGNGNFGSALGPDGQADRPMDPGNHRVGKSHLLQALNPARLGFLGAQGADIKALGFQRDGKSRIINLRIMGQRQKRRARIYAEAPAIRPPARWCAA